MPVVKALRLKMIIAALQKVHPNHSNKRSQEGAILRPFIPFCCPGREHSIKGIYADAGPHILTCTHSRTAREGQYDWCCRQWPRLETDV